MPVLDDRQLLAVFQYLLDEVSQLLGLFALLEPLADANMLVPHV
jgi:hypothetical protein